MTRTCAFPQCQRNIEILPQNHTICSLHQIKFRAFEKTVCHWLDNRLVPEEDSMFAFLHPNPIGCSAECLANHLDLAPSTVQKDLARGIIEGEKYLGPQTYTWRVLQEEQVRVIDLFRNWIEVYKVAKKYNLRCQELRKFVREGEFGPHIKSLSGYEMILITEANNDIRARFFALRKKRSQENFSKRRPKQKFLVEKERTLGSIAKECRVEKTTGYE